MHHHQRLPLPISKGLPASAHKYLPHHHNIITLPVSEKFPIPKISSAEFPPHRIPVQIRYISHHATPSQHPFHPPQIPCPKASFFTCPPQERMEAHPCAHQAILTSYHNTIPQTVQVTKKPKICPITPETGILRECPLVLSLTAMSPCQSARVLYPILENTVVAS